jgi:ribonuclease BN (tRNA processing enzyme)
VLQDKPDLTCELETSDARDVALSGFVYIVSTRRSPLYSQQIRLAGQYHMQAEIGEFKVSSWQVCHPGATVGYRIEGPQGTVAYMPDHEPVLGAVRFLPDREWISGISVADGVDMLIHDSQYTDDEYANRIGWGHSSMKQAMEFTKIAQAKMLVPFHHDPTHKDADLEAMYFDAVSEVKPDFPVIPAKEGDTIHVATGLVV